MKKKAMLFIVILAILFPGLSAQIKVAGNGNIGLHTMSPAYQLDIQSMESRSYYPGRNPLLINHYGLDPRFCSDNKMVFFKTNGTDFANIECHMVIQPSDSRNLENIVSLENRGLTTILKLSGFSFNGVNDPSKRKEVGFLAQEVEQVIPEAVFKNDSTDARSLAYSFFIPYLAEAIKEQQEMIDDLKLKIMDLEVKLVQKGILTSNINSLNALQEKAQLDQNFPNPFTTKTKIGCFIPQGSSFSFICNYTINGKTLQKYLINGKGRQELTIDGSSFAPGTYFYQLVVDGKEVNTRQMIKAK